MKSPVAFQKLFFFVLFFVLFFREKKAGGSNSPKRLKTTSVGHAGPIVSDGVTLTDIFGESDQCSLLQNTEDDKSFYG